MHRNRSAPPGAAAPRPAVSREEVAVWLAASCQAQGVPVLVTDARVLGEVAALLAPAVGGSVSARQRGAGCPASASQPPDRPHPG